MLSLAEGIAVKRRVQSRLFAIPGVHSVGFGAKVTAGRLVGESAILVYVLKKKRPAELALDEKIPPKIEEVGIDVVESSPEIIRTSAVVLQGGDEVNVNGQGTLGCVARLHVPDTSPPDVLLSCRHVLYPDPDSKAGDKARIPCCCCCHQDVGTVLDGPKINDVIDAALAQFDAGVLTKAQVHGLAVKGILDLTDPGLPADIQKAVNDQKFKVFKYGAKTGLTRGVIASADQDIGFPPEIIRPKKGQIYIQPIDRDEFCAEGDSGAVVYDENSRIVGLLWGLHSSDGFGLACHIKPVLDAFPGLRVAKNPPEVVYVTPGIRKLSPVFEPIHRDLTASGCMDYYAGLYGKHLEEVRWLFSHSRHFVSAWHRNHGPKIAQSLMDLAEDRIASLPIEFEGRSWKECANRIAGALLYAGSERLQADVGRYLPFIGALGGNCYADLLQLMRALARTD